MDSDKALPCEACGGECYVVDTAKADRGQSSGEPEACRECNGTGKERCFYKIDCANALALKIVEGFPCCAACEQHEQVAETQRPADTLSARTRAAVLDAWEKLKVSGSSEHAAEVVLFIEAYRAASKLEAAS
jgi:hypothetical protein